MFHRDVYWGLYKMTDEQLKKIIGGEVNEGFIID